jgi:hypothetical protein
MARMCPRAKKSPPQAVKSSSSIPRMVVSLMPRPAYGAVAVTDSFSPGSLIGNAHRASASGCQPARTGVVLWACPLPSVSGHEDTATMAPFRRRRRGASPAAPREPGHVHGLRVVVIGLGGDASRQARATGARRLVPYRSAAVSRRRREGGPGRRRWRVPGWRVLVAGGAPGSGSGCDGRPYCVTA